MEIEIEIEIELKFLQRAMRLTTSRRSSLSVFSVILVFGFFWHFLTWFLRLQQLHGEDVVRTGSGLYHKHLSPTGTEAGIPGRLHNLLHLFIELDVYLGYAWL